MIYLAFTCSLDLYNVSNIFVNQMFSMMNKSFFKVKKSCGDYGCHNNSFVSKAFLVIGDVHLAFFALRSLEPLFKIKRIVFIKDLI